MRQRGVESEQGMSVGGDVGLVGACATVKPRRAEVHMSWSVSMHYRLVQSGGARGQGDLQSQSNAGGGVRGEMLRGNARENGNGFTNLKSGEASPKRGHTCSREQDITERTPMSNKNITV